MEPRSAAEAKEVQERLWDILIGFIGSQALYAGVELGIFTALSGRSLTPEQVAEAVGLDVRPVERVLTALAALGLVAVEGGRYSNSEAAELCLVRGRPYYFGHMVAYYIDNFYPAAGQLVEAARKGEPVIAHWQSFRSEEEVARSSTLAMDNLSRTTGMLLAESLDLSRAERLLDVGGGSGAIARALAERYPQLEAVVLDHPQVLKVAEALWRDSPARSRLKPYPGDFVREELPSGFDVAIASNIIHGYGGGMNQRLMEKIFRCLRPGGTALVLDFYLNDGKDGPLFSALFGIGAHLLGRGARTYSWQEAAGWLRQAGFEEVGAQKLSRLVGYVWGRKPS